MKVYQSGYDVTGLGKSSTDTKHLFFGQKGLYFYIYPHFPGFIYFISGAGISMLDYFLWIYLQSWPGFFRKER
jgi:hypothetical protein